MQARLRTRLNWLLLASTWSFAYATALFIHVATHLDAETGPLRFLACFLGLAAASAVLFIATNPARVPGIAPCGWLATTAVAIWLVCHGPSVPLLGVLTGAIVLTSFPPMLAARNLWRQQPRGRPVWISTAVPALALVAGVLLGPWALVVASQLSLEPFQVRVAFAVAATLSTVVLWAWLYRAALEFLLSVLCIPLYRFSTVGPGAGKIPEHGPLLVVANHAAWLDPFWLGKVIPRPITPMMSSKFFDLPIISFLMRNVVRAVRVQDSAYRHDAPELDEAIRRLGEGECVMIFPEGWLRRREEHVIRNFGQGVWRILREKPDTPVVAFWIEGSWGSWWSHRFAPVGRGKPFDILRKITIGVGEPEVLSAEMLADHRLTRHHLRDRVFGLRAFVPNAEPVAVKQPPQDPEEATA